MYPCNSQNKLWIHFHFINIDKKESNKRKNLKPWKNPVNVEVEQLFLLMFQSDPRTH